jgi:O-antigen ligase
MNVRTEQNEPLTGAPAERAAWPTGLAASRCAVAAAGCALFAILLLSLRHVDGVPAAVVLFLVGLAGLSARRPGAALTLLAVLLPVANWTGRTWNGSVAWPETLVVAFAAGYCARGLRRSTEPADDLGLPIALFTALVCASLAVRLMVLHGIIGAEALALQLVQVASVDYFIGSGGFREVDAAMRLVEGMVLLWAASSVGSGNPAFAPRLVRWFVAGAAAAAALNLWRIWQGALRAESPVTAFVQYLWTLRYNVHYGDVNAAGSYFMMALLPAVALAIAPWRPRWTPAVIVIATSVLLSGSRAAFLAGALAVFSWSAWHLRQRFGGTSSRSLRPMLVSILLLGCAAGLVLYLAARRNVTAPSTALQVRTEFARTTFRMASAYPAFGVGIGQYPDRSSMYSSRLLVETFAMRHENAHNNFFQVLGELGFLGLAGFVWVLWTAGARAVRKRVEPMDPLHQGVLAGLLAFVLTWLSGHPLLIDEPALLFWLLLGAAAGWGSGSVTAAGRIGPWRAATLAFAGLILIVSVGVRAGREIATADLEHRGIGLSGWLTADDGVRYRLAGRTSSVFVPSEARLVTIPLRAREPGKELSVALLLNGRPADVVQVPQDRWRPVQIILNPGEEAPLFSRLDLRVGGSTVQADDLLMIGKIESR